ncbi:DUF5348 domain-containing protein [Candidatus Enterovibrio escicola]|jgi:hypothetical protein|uniref:DUF5348 domain-containing protein n=2 Tax=Pseudomonadota TaxID=1224 RepID=UPI0030DC3ADC|tara:strand:+ start:350 stop:553 length:204 start_codon:yes stop_codon:yes gene_type:complete
MEKVMNRSYLNELGRFECEGVQFTSGDVVEVFDDGEWKVTRIEYSDSQGGYYSVDGYELLGRPLRAA